MCGKTLERGRNPESLRLGSNIMEAMDDWPAAKKSRMRGHLSGASIGTKTFILTKDYNNSQSIVNITLRGSHNCSLYASGRSSRVCDFRSKSG
jgi:hypothetical protein